MAGLDAALTLALRRGERRALAKAITLLESTRADHRARADALLTALLPHTGQALRLGISGVPGVGKSTFIEALGLHLIRRGHRVAVGPGRVEARELGDAGARARRGDERDPVDPQPGGDPPRLAEPEHARQRVRADDALAVAG